MDSPWRPSAASASSWRAEWDAASAAVVVVLLLLAIGSLAIPLALTSADRRTSELADERRAQLIELGNTIAADPDDRVTIDQVIARYALVYGEPVVVADADGKEVATSPGFGLSDDGVTSEVRRALVDEPPEAWATGAAMGLGPGAVGDQRPQGRGDRRGRGDAGGSGRCRGRHHPIVVLGRGRVRGPAAPGHRRGPRPHPMGDETRPQAGARGGRHDHRGRPDRRSSQPAPRSSESSPPGSTGWPRQCEAPSNTNAGSSPTPRTSYGTPSRLSGSAPTRWTTTWRRRAGTPMWQ